MILLFSIKFPNGVMITVQTYRYLVKAMTQEDKATHVMVEVDPCMVGLLDNVLVLENSEALQNIS